MSNMVEIGDWKNLSEVKVGSIIDVNDEDRKVVQNLGIDLLLETDGPFPTSLKALVEEQEDWDGAHEDVFVHEEPASVVARAFSPSLKSTIEARFAKTTPQQSLEQDLAARFGAKKVPASGSFSANADVIVGKVLVGNPFAQAPFVDPVAKLRSELASIASQANSAGYQAKALTDSVHNVQNDIHDLRQDAYNVSGDVSTISSRLAKLEHQSVQDKINRDLEQTKTASSQGGNTMSTLKNLLGGFTNNFGKVSNQFALSPIGLAVKSEPKNPFSTWVAYDKATGTLTDVQNLTFSTDVPAFQLPVGPDQVAVGDIVVNNGDYQYVVEKNDDYIATVCPAKRTRGSVLPVKNMLLNQSFYTVVKTLDLAGEAGFNPALLLAMGKGDKSELLPFLLMSGGIGQGQAGQLDPMTLMMLSDSSEDLLPFILMQQGGATPQGFNPLMLLALSDKGGKSKDLLPLLMMSQGGQGGAGIQSMLPFLMMKDGGSMSDMLPLMMMGGLGGQGGTNPFGNLFGGAPAAPATIEKKSDKDAK